nr:hypothetical protein B456_002G078300 [Ipomoea batatas]
MDSVIKLLENGNIYKNSPAISSALSTTTFGGLISQTAHFLSRQKKKHLSSSVEDASVEFLSTKKPGSFGLGKATSSFSNMKTTDAIVGLSSGSRHDRWLSSGQASCLISSLLPSRSTRIPLSLRISLPEVLFSGVSLLATQTTSLVGILLYQMPTYRFLDFPGLKNPSSKLPPAETMVVPSVMG